MRFWGALFVQIDLSSAEYSWEPKNGQNLNRPLVMNMTKVHIIVSHLNILSITPKQIVYQTSYEPTFPSAYRLDSYRLYRLKDIFKVTQKDLWRIWTVGASSGTETSRGPRPSSPKDQVGLSGRRVACLDTMTGSTETFFRFRYHKKFRRSIHSKNTWVCLKMGYTPNYIHLVGIMIINHWV